MHVGRDEKTHHFTFFQVTRSARHTRKYKYMTEFINPFLGAERNTGPGKAVSETGMVLNRVAGGPTHITVKLIALVRVAGGFQFDAAEGRLVPAPEVLAMEVEFESPPRAGSGTRSIRYSRIVDLEEDEDQTEEGEGQEGPRFKKAKSGGGKEEASTRGRKRRGGK